MLEYLTNLQRVRILYSEYNYYALLVCGKGVPL